jgi:hypothetical protein
MRFLASSRPPSFSHARFFAGGDHCRIDRGCKPGVVHASVDRLDCEAVHIGCPRPAVCLVPAGNDPGILGQIHVDAADGILVVEVRRLRPIPGEILQPASLAPPVALAGADHDYLCVFMGSGSPDRPRRRGRKVKQTSQNYVDAPAHQGIRWSGKLPGQPAQVASKVVISVRFAVLASQQGGCAERSCGNPRIPTAKKINPETASNR